MLADPVSLCWTATANPWTLAIRPEPASSCGRAGRRCSGHPPFTIILRDRLREDSVVHPHRVKLDPGSRPTGLALVRATDSRVP